MNRVAGRVAFITGAARGQGRSHCVRLASEGAKIIAVDNCADVETIPYGGATSGDLAETVRLVEQAGGEIEAREVDVRDLAALTSMAVSGVRRFGRLDIVSANAGVCSFGNLVEMDEMTWQTVIDINLTGVWKTIRATVPSMISAGNGGAVVITSSTAGLKALRTLGHYVAAKHGVVGLTKSLANEVAAYDIRVNSIAPTNVDTAMLKNPGVYRQFRPDLDEPSSEDALPGMVEAHLLAHPMVEVEDVTNALMYLVSDAARYVTGVTLPVDLGLSVK